MTSRTEKQPPDSKLETTALLEQVAANLHYKSTQLQRTLWLAAVKNGGKLILDEKEIDMLWRLGFDRTPEGLLVVEAIKTPEADPADIERAAKDLTGSNALLSEYAVAHDRLRDYPLEYLEYRISQFIRFDGEKWVSVAEFEAKRDPSRN